ncbi:MAG: glycosyltransferase family 2 protein [Microgenomates group bacterium]
MKHAVVIIPTYNERENIQAVVPALQEVFETVQNWKMSILVVDDTSPDKTYEVVTELSKTHKNLFLLKNLKKSGLGGAYLKGMEEAFGEMKADVIFEFDADLSHDPKKIPLFLEAIDNGADMVLGSRYIPGGSIPQNWGLHRKFLSVVGNIVIATILTNFSIRDWTTGYRAISKKVYERVHKALHTEQFSGYTFQIGFLHAAVKNNFKIVEVPFNFSDRTIGHSKLGPEYIKNTLLYIMRVRMQDLFQNRIFKFALVGGVGALIQLTSLQLWRTIAPFQLAFFLSIETAIISNFVLNNSWTFSDRKLETKEIPKKFLQFNFTSGGSILIQQLVAIFGELLIGLYTLFIIPIIMFPFDTGTLFALVGILLGMSWNFFAYTKFIWKSA